MSYSTDLLDAFIAAKGLSSDRQAMAALGLSHGAAAHWRQGRGHAGPEAIAEMCKVTGKDEAEHQMRIARERARSKAEGDVWARMLKRMGYAAALVFSCTLPYFAASNNANANGRLDIQTHFSGVYYVKFWIGRVRDLARSLMRSAAHHGAAAHATA